MTDKHSHYFKDVSNLQRIDVYRVLELFEVTNPCLQHAIKKLLVAGGRGAKSTDKDIREAIDSLQRYIEMRNEDVLLPVQPMPMPPMSTLVIPKAPPNGAPY